MLKNTRIWLGRRRSPIRSQERSQLRSRRSVLAAFVRAPLAIGVGLSSRQAFAARSRQEREHAERTIAAALDRMLPSEVLPGALQLGLDRRIAAINDRELKQSLGKCVAWLDDRAIRRYRSRFISLEHTAQDLVLQAALNSRTEGANAIVYTLRKLALTFYYTHPAIVKAFPYAGPPQPAGFPDFKDPPQ
jgi:hypothetical protein